MFLPINLLRTKCINGLAELTNKLTRTKNIVAARIVQHVLERIDQADPKTIEYVIDELAETGDKVYLGLLHIKRMMDIRYASKFFEQEAVYTFEGQNWVSLWQQLPSRKTRFIIGEYVKRVPKGHRLFILGVQQEHIDHIILHVMHGDDIGYISLNGEMALYPSKYFKRV